MELKDLQVGTLVRIVNNDFVSENFTSTRDGFICNKTHKYLSNDMKYLLIGKDLNIQAIDEADEIMPIKVNGFWIPIFWIEKIAPKPKVSRRRASSKVPTHAADGSKFGALFTTLLTNHPDIGILSKNRFSQLTDDELDLICSKLNVSRSSNKLETANNITQSLIAMVPKA